MLNTHRARSRVIAAAAFAAGLALALSSCSSPSAPAGGTEQHEAAPGFLAVADDALTGSGALTVQLDYDTSEADGLDPQTAQTARSWMIMGLVYETLVTTDEKFAIAPGLATSWKQPDDTTYVFTIDTSAKFSNGRALSTADVVGSLKRLAGGKSIWTGQLGPVSSITATGANEVTVKLSAPYAPFLAALANTPAAILPMQEIEQGTLDPKTAMLGTGPYVVVSHRQDQSWKFAANPAWRGGEIPVRDLELQIVAQESTRQAGLREGSAGMANFVNIDALTQLAGTAGVKVVNQTQSDFYYLYENSQRPGSPLQDQDVRFAINTAVDRKAISDIVFAGTASPTGITPSNLPGACAVGDLPSERATVEEAKRSIDGAKLGDRKLSLLVYTSEPVLAQMAQLIQQQLAEVGVAVTIEQYDAATYRAKIETAKPGDFDLALGWYAGYGDPSMVTKWWNPEQALFNTGFVGVHEDLNRLIDQGASTLDPKERAKVLTELCASADRYSEIVPLVHRPSIIGYSTKSVSPTIASNEGYGDILRNLTDYRVVGK